DLRNGAVVAAALLILEPVANGVDRIDGAPVREPGDLQAPQAELPGGPVPGDNDRLTGIGVAIGESAPHFLAGRGRVLDDEAGDKHQWFSYRWWCVCPLVFDTAVSSAARADHAPSTPTF